MTITGIDFNVLTTTLTAGVVVLGAVCLWQWSELQRLKRILSRIIKENLCYKYGYPDQVGDGEGGYVPVSIDNE